ncbi:MAG: RNA-binding protein [Nitrospirales bacterium]|nr:RNA-binding protein [Nitrospirales bacterium]
MNLFVDGLPSSFSSQDLSDLFTDFGTVLKAEVVKNPEGNSLQFGFVAMGTSQEAYRAMASLNRSIVRDHSLLVVLAENQWSAGRSHYSTQDTPSSFA